MNKIIRGFPKYAVGCDGSIWSRHSGTWKELRPHPDRDGYLQVTLCHNKKRTFRKVHHLVLEAFVGRRPKGAECRHLDGNPTNNEYTNLKWGSSLENSDDVRKHGALNKGSRNGNSKLTDAQVRIIRKELVKETRGTQKRLADRFGVSRSLICQIKTGKVRVDDP